MKKLLLAATALLLSAGVAQAASVFSIRDSDGVHRAYYVGDVWTGDSIRLRNLLDDNPDITELTMISGGGHAFEGFAVGRVIAEFGISVHVPEGQYCMSACANAALASPDLDIDGAVGFHKAWTTLYGDYMRGFSDGQTFGAYTSAWYQATGMNWQFIRMSNELTSPDVFLVFFHENDLNKFRFSEDADIEDLFERTVDVDDTWLQYHIMDPNQIRKYIGVLNV